MKNKMQRGQCRICGARIPLEGRGGVVACDGVCRRAYSAGLRREQQLRADMIAENRVARDYEEELEHQEHRRHNDLEDYFYNQPYLAEGV